MQIQNLKHLHNPPLQKTLFKALLNINNSACASTSRAESKDLDSAIFAEQKSNQYIGAIAPTDTRPLRGAQSLEKGGSSALRNDCARSGKSEALPDCRKDPTGCKRSAAKTVALYSFRGFSERGGDNTPFSFAQTSDSVNLNNIRESVNPLG